MNKTNKIIQGTYSDYKIVKSRSVAQIVVEIPLEAAENFVQMFGMPLPSSEKWVALAMLNEQNIEKNKDVEMAIQKCGMLCKQEVFGMFIKENKGVIEVNPFDSESVANGLRKLLGIKSRTEFRDEEIFRSWNHLLSEYEQWILNRNKK